MLTLDGYVEVHRVEDIGGLSPAFSLTARVRLSPGTISLGTIAQTKAALFDLSVTKAPGSQGSLLVAASPSSQSVAASIDPAAWHTITVDVTRGDVASVWVDGDELSTIEWSSLPDVDLSVTPASYLTSSDQVLVMFWNQTGHSVWDEVDYSICGPTNVALGIQTVVPPPGPSRVLKGGMGETLDGLTGLTATLDRVDVVEETVPGDASTARVITVSSGPQPVTFATSLDDTSIRPMSGLTVPPGTVTQLRLVVSDVSIALRGAAYPVKVPSGAQTGIKVNVENGAIVVPHTGDTGLVIELPLFDHLIRNRGQGFVMPPVMKRPACLCTVDDLTGECTGIVDPLCGTGGEPGGAGGGNKEHVFTAPPCRQALSVVPMVVDTLAWVDFNRHSPTTGLDTYDPGVRLDIPLLFGTRSSIAVLDFARIDLRLQDTVVAGTSTVSHPGGVVVALSHGETHLAFVSKHVAAGARPGGWPTGTGMRMLDPTVYCDPAASPYPDVQDMPLLPPVNAVVVGLQETGDVVFLRIPGSPADHQALATVKAGGPASFDADLFAWHGDTVTADGFETSARSGSSEWLDLPPSQRGWVVAVRSAHGAGAVELRRAIVWRSELPGSLNTDLEIPIGAQPPPGARKCRRLAADRRCIVCETLHTHDIVFHGPDCPYSSPPPSPSSGSTQIRSEEQELCVGLKRAYSAYKGIFDLHTLHVWLDDDSCGGGILGASACDIEVLPSTPNGRSYAFRYEYPLPRPGVIYDEHNLRPADTWVFPHELGHYLLNLCDEYVDTDSSGNLDGPHCAYRDDLPPVQKGSACGHSVMSDNYGAMRALCTDDNHGRDGPTPVAPPSSWSVALNGHIAPALPTLDSLDFSAGGLAGHFRLVRMNYGGNRVIVCK